MENRVVSQPVGIVSINKEQSNSYKPLVSVVTPVFNGVKYLEECIQSVLQQSYPNIEHVLVDGASTDGTAEMLASYQAKYPDRIRFISEPDEGIGVAVNKGLRMAKGAIFGGLQSDDFYEPEAVQTVVEFFRANPDAYFVYGNYRVVNAKGETTNPGTGKQQTFTVKDMINKGCYFGYTSAFYKREVVDRVGFFEPFGGSDYEYWIRVGKVFQLYSVENVLSAARIHAGSRARGASIQEVRKHKRINYFYSRYYGASIFSLFCRNYYKFLIMEALRPMLGFAYPWLKKMGVK